jgi:uncharacterized membrane protein
MDGAPEAAWPVFVKPIGYVQHVDVASLEDCAKTADREVFVMALPGAFADPARPVAMVSGPEDEAISKVVAEAYTVGAERTFDQDPRFGLCVLAEIASRALSPAAPVGQQEPPVDYGDGLQPAPRAAHLTPASAPSSCQASALRRSF